MFCRKMKISTITTHCVALVLGCFLIRLIDISSTSYDLRKEKLLNSGHVKNYAIRTIPMNPDGSPDIPKIMEETRSKIKEDLKNYNFSYSGVHKLEDLVLEAGGRPLRSIVISSWRSGSTFLGEILNAMPGNFYHYEPLRNYEIQQIRGPPHAVNATRMLKSMLKCNYDNKADLNDYFEYKKNHLQQFRHNTRMWEFCSQNKELCLDEVFTRKFCELFPFQSMKLVRYRLKLVHQLLGDETLNVKVVLEIRDPRAVLQSRHHHTFCPPAPDCWDPAVVCSDMVDDYTAAARLLQLYPGRLIVLRYEDLALNPRSTSHRLYSFLGLDVTPSLDEFLETHTKADLGCMSSTFRESSVNAFKWKNLLDFDYANTIQKSCIEAMKLWGYRAADNATHMASKEFNPLGDYTI